MKTIDRGNLSTESGYVSVLERVPIADRNLESRRPASLELSRKGHALLATAAMFSVLVAPLVLPPAAAVIRVLAAEVTRAPWAEIVPAYPIGIGDRRR